MVSAAFGPMKMSHRSWEAECLVVELEVTYNPYKQAALYTLTYSEYRHLLKVFCSHKLITKKLRGNGNIS